MLDVEERIERTNERGDVADELAVLWRRHRPEALARVRLLDEAIATLREGKLSDELCEAARSAAHKLKGSSGPYGFSVAGRIAGELEDVLAGDRQVAVDRAAELASMVAELRTALERNPRRGPHDRNDSGARLSAKGPDGVQPSGGLNR
jgi:chemotaxis protein histidine kinase CheA